MPHPCGAEAVGDVRPHVCREADVQGHAAAHLRVDEMLRGRRRLRTQRLLVSLALVLVHL
jgi:hypothetical protein